MAKVAPDTASIKAEVKEAPLPEDIESQIKTAMGSRIAYFKEQSDSLTFESVRRLLEKDLGLKPLALDVRKRFVRECLQEFMNGSGNDNASKNCGETVDTEATTMSEVAEPAKGNQSKKEAKQPHSEDEKKMEDSPVMGLLTATTESNKTEHEETKEISQSEIKKAIRKRASYLVANSDQVTMAILRRLLEEDMKLDKHTLDPYKKFISEQLDEVLKSREVSTILSKAKKSVKTKASRKPSTKESSDSEEEEEVDEEVEERSKRKVVTKGRFNNSKGLNKRKRPEKETKAPSKKIKAPQKESDDGSDAEDGVVSEDGQSQSSTEKAVKRKEASTPVYGKRVEHLKSIIKSCGMSVPPVIYKKVKQAPENKREAHLTKELEGILSKEGLSPNPSEKEIKEVKKRKDRAKELEGIDTSNIVSSSRRRSATSFVPPKPKIVDSSDDDDDDTDDDEDDEDNEDGDGGDEGNDGSQSEESNEGEDEDSD